MCLPIHRKTLEEMRGLAPLVINCVHCKVYVPKIHYRFDHILTVPFREYIASFMIPLQLNYMRFMGGEIYVVWVTPIEH